VHSTLHGWLALVGCTAIAAALAAQPPSKPDAADAKGTAPRTVEDLGVPSNAVIVIGDDPKKVLGMVPRFVLLSPERYEELLRLEREGGARAGGLTRPAVPTACKLNGQVEGELARLQVQFQIMTERPRTVVALGCQRAWARSAALDGALPLFLTDGAREEGLLVQVDKPGNHTLTLDLALPLTSRGTRGNERGFDLGLPHCAMTNLDQFRFPVTVTEAKLNGQVVRAKAEADSSRLENLPLGPADRLDLSWKAPTAAVVKGAPVYSAEGRLAVRVEEKNVVTDVELQLEVLRGEMPEWRIQLPRGLGFDLKEPGPADERLERREFHDPWLTLRLKKPSAEPLRVVFQVQQPRTESALPIGPFLVPGALRQSGAITVSAPPETRLSFQTQGDVTPRDVPDDAARNQVAAAFTYWSLPARPDSSDPAPPPLLQLDVHRLQGVIESRVEHTLELMPAGWKVATKIEFTPVRAALESVEIQVPEGYPYDSEKGVTPDELADPPVFDAQRRVATIKLAQKQIRPFTLTLPALYPVPSGTQQAVLDLPKPLHTADRGGQTIIQLPNDVELAARSGDAEGAAVGVRRNHRYTRTWDRAPTRLELAWHPYRPELRVESVLDVTVHPRRAAVRHRFDLQVPGRALERVALQIPSALVGRVRVLQGGVLDEVGTVKLDRGDGKPVLILAYDVPLAERSAADAADPSDVLAAFPVVRVAQATHAETKARFWCSTALQVSRVNGPWDELALETVPENDALPVLVLRTNSLEPALTLRVIENRAGLAPVVVDRGLVQVAVVEGGFHSYRARYLLDRIGARHLDIELPAPLSMLNLAVLLDGRRITNLRSVDNGGNAADRGSLVRVAVEPDLYHKPAMLELRYQLAPGRRRGSSLLSSTFVPPVLSGAVLLGPVRWQVNTAAGSVYLYRTGNHDTEQAWTWRGGLLTPTARADGNELERWLTGAKDLELDEPAEPSVECWRSELEPIQVVHVPRAAWLLTCSVLVLALGLVLAIGPVSRGTMLGAAVILSLLLIGAGLAWPEALPLLLYGCEPGLIVLVLLALGYGAARLSGRRSRHLPAFSRVPAGSSLVQPGSSHRHRREPTTVDAPVAPRSSVLRRQQAQEP
jgi:hypothetical protein